MYTHLKFANNWLRASPREAWDENIYFSRRIISHALTSLTTRKCYFLQSSKNYVHGSPKKQLRNNDAVHCMIHEAVTGWIYINYE